MCLFGLNIFSHKRKSIFTVSLPNEVYHLRFYNFLKFIFYGFCSGSFFLIYLCGMALISSFALPCGQRIFLKSIEPSTNNTIAYFQFMIKKLKREVFIHCFY